MLTEGKRRRKPQCRTILVLLAFLLTPSLVTILFCLSLSSSPILTLVFTTLCLPSFVPCSVLSSLHFAISLSPSLFPPLTYSLHFWRSHCSLFPCDLPPPLVSLTLTDNLLSTQQFWASILGFFGVKAGETSWCAGLLSRHINKTGSCAFAWGRNLVVQDVAPEMTERWEICRAGLVTDQLTMGRREGKALLVGCFAGTFILAKGCKKAVCMQPYVQSAFSAGQCHTGLDDLSANSHELSPFGQERSFQNLQDINCFTCTVPTELRFLHPVPCWSGSQPIFQVRHFFNALKFFFNFKSV